MMSQHMRGREGGDTAQIPNSNLSAKPAQSCLAHLPPGSSIIAKYDSLRAALTYSLFPLAHCVP